MRWGIISGTGVAGPPRWLDDLVVDSHHQFVKLNSEKDANWHDRTTSRHPLSKFAGDLLQAPDVSGLDGIITTFPPPAVVAGLRNRLRTRPLRHVAWTFNLGHHPQGWRRWLSRVALANVDRLIVHSTAEVAIVRTLFGLSEEQVRFVHLQSPERPVLAVEEREQPFIAAIGSANRDYPTLIEALRRTGLPAKIVASPRLLTGLDAPANVECLSGLSREACMAMAQQARICVVPIADPDIASGQVTVIDSLIMGRPVVATRSIGTVDYIADGVTGLLVEPHSADELAAALQSLWEDEARRQAIATAGRAFAKAELSDDAAARKLRATLDEIEAG